MLLFLSSRMSVFFLSSFVWCTLHIQSVCFSIHSGHWSLSSMILLTSYIHFRSCMFMFTLLWILISCFTKFSFIKNVKKMKIKKKNAQTITISLSFRPKIMNHDAFTIINSREAIKGTGKQSLELKVLFRIQTICFALTINVNLYRMLGGRHRHYVVTLNNPTNMELWAIIDYISNAKKIRLSTMLNAVYSIVFAFEYSCVKFMTFLLTAQQPKCHCTLFNFALKQNQFKYFE